MQNVGFMKVTMGWFHKICRDVGLMLHNIKRPDHETKVTRHEVEEEKRGNMTLRRTTIEEIETDAKQEDTHGGQEKDRKGGQ